MSVRERLSNDKKMGVAIGIALILVAALALAIQFWPKRKANLEMAYFTDDDGKTWFEDSTYQVAPFMHDGKTAVIAEIYSYDNGSKRFCAYLAKYTPDAQKRLEAALADARSKGQPPDSIELYHDPGFIRTGMLAKLPGDNNSWIPYTDSRVGQIFSIHSPDGSQVDEVFVY